MTKQLSPATQAVLDAFRSSHTGQGCLAAALRAAADQVVPTWDKPGWEHELVMGEWQEGQRIRTKLLAIASELEAQ